MQSQLYSRELAPQLWFWKQFLRKMGHKWLRAKEEKFKEEKAVKKNNSIIWSCICLLRLCVVWPVWRSGAAGGTLP